MTTKKLRTADFITPLTTCGLARAAAPGHGAATEKGSLLRGVLSASQSRVEQPPIAATNKCLARSNKTRRVIRATKDTNGHWTVGTAEGPCAVGRTPRAQPTSPTSV